MDLALNATPGAVAGWLLGLDAAGILALAGATYVSSSGIIARLLGDLRRLSNRETPAVLSVLVLEDFAMAAYLPLLAVVTAGGTWWEALFAVLAATSVVGAAVTASSRWGHHVGRVLSPADAEQVLLRVLGFTLVVAALAELIHVSAAVGAFLIGLTLTGAAAERARTVLSPLRDLFAAVFFLALGMSADPGHLLPALPAAAALALVTAITKVATGWYAAGRDGAGRRGRLRAGTALVARGEFSVVVIGLATTAQDRLGALVTCYVIILAVCGPVLTRLAPTRSAPPRKAAPDGGAGMLSELRSPSTTPTPGPARSADCSG
nr:cation:proton antiporter [Streptomyces sp. AC627_RSS907]